MHALRMLMVAQIEDSRERLMQRRQSLEKFLEMSDAEFILHFRLNKATFYTLCADLRQFKCLKGSRQYPLEIKVLCTLSFLATGSYQRLVGVGQSITQRTVSRILSEVITALTSPSFVRKWIMFPATRQERNVTKLEFQRKYRLPGVVGCIDCTHIAIVRPTSDEHAFYNRKGYHSMNTQMICDANLKILSVNPKFGGASHDSHIWSCSKMETYMRKLHRNQEHVWLLGDSGYAQRPWLMTPILNAIPGSQEDIYTRRHMQARNCIERCFGLLKSRWRCLLRHRALHYAPGKAANIIVACSVLHNIALAANLPLIEIINEEDSVEVNISNDIGNQNEITQGRAFRTNLLVRLTE